MLVLTRKLGEDIIINGNITVRIIDIRSNQVRVGIDAPKETTILRKELVDAPR